MKKEKKRKKNQTHTHTHTTAIYNKRRQYLTFWTPILRVASLQRRLV